jgi:hypothetical protein
MRRSPGERLMSCNFAVWFSYQRLSDSEAGKLYTRLCQTNDVQPHLEVDAFYADLIAKHPEIDTVPDDRIDDHDYCPWSCALDHSSGHVIMPCVWSKADYVERLVHELAQTYGLVVYDPQSNHATYPDSPAVPIDNRRPWWHVW